MTTLRWRWVIRLLIWTLAGLLAIALSVAFFFIYPVMSDPEPKFLPRKGELTQVQLTRQWQQAADAYRELTLVSSSGLMIDICIRRPAAVQQPLPLVVLLGGFRTGRNAATLLPGSYPAVIAALSYPYSGDRDMQGMGLLRNIPHVQQTLRDVTPGILLTLDYLLQREEVDPGQVELVGVSLGAFLAPPAAALDKRITRAWLVQGAGDPGSLYGYQLRDNIAWDGWRRVSAGLLALLSDVHHLAPEHWVGRIAPRPVIVINSRQDPAFPAENVRVLHAALAEPHEIIWLEEGGHVRPDETAIIRQLTDIVLARITSGRD